MNHLPNISRRNRQSMGRPRRQAMSSGAMLAEMPNQLRKFHLGGPSTKSMPTRGKDNRGGEGSGSVKKPTRRGHVRQGAMIWDDFVGIVRVERMKAERKKMSVQKLGRTSSDLDLNGFKHADHSTLTSSSGTHQYCPELPSELVSGDEVPSKVLLVSPPRLRRMKFCFDDSNNGCQQRLKSPFERMARRLTPPSLTRLTFGFHRGSDSRDKALQRGPSTSTMNTHFSDGEDTFSLEYSDDDSDIERAIHASAAIPHAIVVGAEGTQQDFQCAICLDSFTDRSNRATVSCGHSFCFKCIDRWAEKKNECPLCKKGFHLVASDKRVRWY